MQEAPGSIPGAALRVLASTPPAAASKILSRPAAGVQACGRPAYATAAPVKTRSRERLFHLQPATAYRQLSHGMQARGRPMYTTAAAARTRPRPLRPEGCCRHRQAATGYRRPPPPPARFLRPPPAAPLAADSAANCRVPATTDWQPTSHCALSIASRDQLPTTRDDRTPG